MLSMGAVLDKAGIDYSVSEYRINGSTNWVFVAEWGPAAKAVNLIKEDAELQKYEISIPAPDIMKIEQISPQP